MKKEKHMLPLLLLVVAFLMGMTACSTENAKEGNTTEDSAAGTDTAEEDTATTDTGLSGDIIIDGSSTVFPITEAITEEFRKLNPDVNIPIGVSGTGGGFKKFVIGESDINDASRPIKDAEKETAEENGIEYEEFMIAYDGISVVVNPENDYVDSLTVEELNELWKADSTIKTWKDLRDDWPDEEIRLYGPGTDSGTFDYFTEEINGESGSIRTDYTPSEDDNVLVQGIAGDKNAIGFFGFSYYIENQDILKAVKIDNGDGPVAPAFETIKDGSYAPLSRPIYIYVTKDALAKDQVKAFVEYYLTEGASLISEVGYVELDDASYQQELSKLE